MEDEFDAGAALAEAGLEESTPEMDDAANSAEPVEQSDQPPEESAEFNAEDFLNNTEIETPSVDGLLEIANGLQLPYKGDVYQFESEDQVREALSKGIDYTFEKQQFSESRKAQEAEWTEKVQAQEEEYNQKLEAFDNERGEYEQDRIENQLMLDVLNGLKETDPTTYEEIAGGFRQAYDSYNRSITNPVVTGLQSQVKELQGRLGDKDKTELNDAVSGIEKEWETGLAQLQTEKGAQMRSLGIKPNWDEVKKVWQAGNAGGAEMDPSKAFYAVHAAALEKAWQAKNKAAETARKSRERRGPAKPSGNPEVLGQGQSNEDYIQELISFGRAQ